MPELKLVLFEGAGAWFNYLIERRKLMIPHLDMHRFIGLVTMIWMASTAQAQTSLANPDFELGQEGTVPPGWTVQRGKFVLDTQKKLAGNFAGKLDGGEGAAVAHQDVAVVPGTSYQLSGYWRNGDRTADFDTVVVEISWLSGPGGKSLGRAIVQDSGPVVSNWTPFALSAGVAPSGAQAARIILKSRFGVGAFDNLTWGTPQGGSESSAAKSVPALNAGTAIPPTETAGIPPLSRVLSSTPGPKPSRTPSVRPASPVLGNSSQLPDLSKMTQMNPAPPATAASDLSQSGGQLTWVEDLRTARATAASERKPILVFFTKGDEAMRQLEVTLFTNPAILEVVSMYVPVRLELEKNRNLALALQVTEPGTVTLYDSRGEFLTRIEKPTVETLLPKLKAPTGR